MEKPIFSSLLEEYLIDLKLLEEVKTLVNLSIEQNAKKWTPTKPIEALNIAFDWDLSKQGFEFWEKLDSEFRDYEYIKKLKTLDIPAQYISIVPKMNKDLIGFLLSKNCLKEFLNNCATFIDTMTDFLETPITLEQHLLKVSDIVNSFMVNKTPEGIEFWKEIHKALQELN